MNESKNISKEYSLNMGIVNGISVFMILPILLFTVIPYLYFWNAEMFREGVYTFINFIIPILVVGTLIHEFLHGITWALFSKQGMKCIKFGFKWKYLTPYCHCTIPLKVSHYRAGVVMPLLILGIIPALIGLVVGSSFLLSFGIFFTWAAGGDIISLFMLMRIKQGTMVQDHPDKMGFIIA